MVVGLGKCERYESKVSYSCAGFLHKSDLWGLRGHRDGRQKLIFRSFCGENLIKYNDSSVKASNYNKFLYLQMRLPLLLLSYN